MKYFIHEKERRLSGGTCYFEFQKGRFKNKFWLENSVCMQTDLFDSLNLFKLFSDVIQPFNYYGPNEVSEDQWSAILHKAQENKQWAPVMEELRPWAEKCLATHRYFTICGV